MRILSLLVLGCLQQRHAECFLSHGPQQQHQRSSLLAWTTTSSTRTRKPLALHAKQASKKPAEEQDWRAFRAKLVLQELQQAASTSSDYVEITLDDDIVDPSSSSWAYESGTIVEQGSVLLNHPPTTKPYEFFGYSLGMQYLHKSVMLVLEHEAHTTTSTIMLNRPTDLTLQDEDGFEAQIWYGGPNHGIHSDNPKFYCLHNLPQDDDDDSLLGRNVIHGIGFTAIDSAKAMVQRGEAEASDFWVFCGYCEFESEVLVEELEQHLWHSVSTDGKTVRNGLRILNAGAGLDPRNAGLSTWSMLMKMIGNKEEDEHQQQQTNEQDKREWASEYPVSFDDLMLHEWATKNLVFQEEAPPLCLQEATTPVGDELVSDMDTARVVRPGTMVRGSSAVPSPFLLEHQEFHKSLVLILQDDENFSVGVLLNHPTQKHVDLEMLVAESFFEKELTFSVPLRYGGPMDFDDEHGDVQDTPLFFLHNNAALRKAGIGEPIGAAGLNGIWRCTTDDAAEAIAKSIAEPQDFMVINGFCIWHKDPETGFGGMGEEVRNGSFEVVSSQQIDSIWDTLLSQKQLSRQTLFDNVKRSNRAWEIAGGEEGRNDLASNDATVFNSDVKVSSLSDDALKVWTAAFFLDDPTLHP